MLTCRSQSGEFETAAMYLHPLMAAYEPGQWHGIEMSILELYSLCMKKLDRLEESVHVYLSAIAKAVAFQDANTSASNKSRQSLRSLLDGGQARFEEVLEVAQAPFPAIKASLEDYFSDIKIHPCIQHSKNQDGFGLGLSLFSRLPGEVEEATLEVDLTGLDENRSQTIKVRTEKPAKITPGQNSLTVVSKVCSWHDG